MCNGVLEVAGAERVAVIGATGWQGGAVVQALQAASPTVQIVAVTRNAASTAAQKLASLRNVEVREANLDDVDSLVRAFAGCDRVFGVTQFWNTPKNGSEHLGSVNCSVEKEIQQGKNIGLATVKAGCSHLVFSSMENTMDSRYSTAAYHIPKHGGYRVPHCDSKGIAAAYLRGLEHTGVLDRVTILNTCFFYENFFDLCKPVLVPGTCGPCSAFLFGWPTGETDIPMMSVKDLGACAAAFLLRAPKECPAEFFAAGQRLPMRKVAAIYGSVVDRPVLYVPVPRAVFALYPFEGAADLANMLAFKRDVPEYAEDRDPSHLAAVLKDAGMAPPTKLQDWLRENRESISAPTIGKSLSSLWWAFFKLKVFGAREVSAAPAGA